MKHEAIQLLKGLTAQELKSFSRFIRSPYFNKSPLLVTLFNILRRYHPEFTSGNLTKEKLHSLLYKSRKYNDGLIRYNLHNLAVMLKEFLMFHNFRGNYAMKEESLRTELMSRNLQKVYYRIEKQKESTENEPMLEKFKRVSDRFYFEMINNKSTQKRFIVDEIDKLKSAIINFTGYFITESMKHNTELLNYASIYNLRASSAFVRNYTNLLNLDRLKHFLIKNGLEDNVLLLAYIYQLKAFLNFNNIKDYYLFRNHLIENGYLLQRDEIHFLFGRLADYCIEKINTKDEKKMQFSRELLEIYDFILENKYYRTSSNKHLQDELFRNIVVNYSRLKRFEDAELFIQRYKNELARNQRNNIVNFSYARMYFEKKEYEPAFEYLAKIKYNTFRYRLEYRMLLIKLNFETGKYIEVFDMCDAMRQFISTNTFISEERRASYNSFIKYIKKITDAKIEKDEDILFLKVKIEANKHVPSKDWLVEKIMESKFYRKMKA